MPDEDVFTDVGPTPDNDRSPRWIVWLVVVCVFFVGGGIFYHLSSENASRYLVELRDGQIVVRKGIFFPSGAADFDGGPAYASFSVPAGMSFEKQLLTDLVAVDKVLYRLFMDVSAAAIEGGEETGLDLARKLLGRARLLPNISEQEADDILRYKGDIAMAEGQMALREVGGLLDRARERLKDAETRGTRIYKDAAGWLRWITLKQAEFKALEGSKVPPPAEGWCVPPADLPRLDAPAPAPPLPAPVSSSPEGLEQGGGPAPPASALPGVSAQGAPAAASPSPGIPSAPASPSTNLLGNAVDRAIGDQAGEAGEPAAPPAGSSTSP